MAARKLSRNELFFFSPDRAWSTRPRFPARPPAIAEIYRYSERHPDGALFGEIERQDFKYDGVELNKKTDLAQNRTFRDPDKVDTTLERACLSA